MLGYDWPRLHAALNDLPMPFLAAVLFDLLAVVTRRPGFGRWASGPCWSARSVGRLPCSPGSRPRSISRTATPSTGSWRLTRQLGLITLGDLRRARPCGESCGSTGWGAGSGLLALVVSLAGVGVLFATGVYGGRLVFEHAAGIPTTVLQGEIQERAKDHHHEAGDGARCSVAPDSSASPLSGAAITSIRPARRPTRTDDAATPHGSDRCRVSAYSVPADYNRTVRSLRCRRPRGGRSASRYPMATRRLAEALKADSIPAQKVGFRTDISRPRGSMPATDGRPGEPRDGTGVVRIRAWADPARPGSTSSPSRHSTALADPSLPYRELERQVGAGPPGSQEGRQCLREAGYGAVTRSPPLPQAQPAKVQQPSEEPAILS